MRPPPTHIHRPHAPACRPAQRRRRARACGQLAGLAADGWLRDARCSAGTQSEPESSDSEEEEKGDDAAPAPERVETGSSMGYKMKKFFASKTVRVPGPAGMTAAGVNWPGGGCGGARWTGSVLTARQAGSRAGRRLVIGMLGHEGDNVLEALKQACTQFANKKLAKVRRLFSRASGQLSHALRAADAQEERAQAGAEGKTHGGRGAHLSGTKATLALAWAGG